MAEGLKYRKGTIILALPDHKDWKESITEMVSALKKASNKSNGHEGILLLVAAGIIDGIILDKHDSLSPPFFCCECKTSLTKGTTHICKKCGHSFCSEHVYTYVDGNNIAITRNSPEYCERCYREVYGG